VEILVDYNNINPSTRQRGLVYVVERICERLGSELLSDHKHLTFRLYGGWYDERTLSPRAQRLIAERERDFPRKVTVPSEKDPPTLIVQAEMAHSLACLPTKKIWRTYRKRGAPRGIRCENPRDLGCECEDCPLIPTHLLVTNQCCPQEHCEITFRDVLSRRQQKQVDTMLAVDLLYYARTEQEVGVVSSDDDFWPPILQALSGGSRIVHVQTQPDRVKPFHDDLTSEYVSRTIV